MPMQTQLATLHARRMYDGGIPSSANEQRLVYQAGSLPMKVVCLTQVVNPEELKDDEEYNNILEDMREEGGKYGNLVNIVIPRPVPSGGLLPGVGKGDEAIEVQKKLESWLPVTASRKANWYYSAFHNVTAMVGAGVLGLPFAFSELGWSWGVSCLVVSWLITFYTMWQLVMLHECAPGKRFDRYHELGQHVFGPKLGLWLIVPQQLLVQISTDIVYGVTGGKSLQKFFLLVAPSIGHHRLVYFISGFGLIQVFLSQTPNFNSLKSVSSVAALMSFCYSGMACVASIIKGTNTDADYSLRANTTSENTFNVFNALGTIGFAFAGHSVALEIQATIPSTPEKKSTKPMWQGCLVAYIIVALCYTSVSFSGYWAFGNKVEDDVLISLENPKWLIATANFMVFLHVIGSYQIFAMPIFDMIESLLVLKMKFEPGQLLRIVARTSYVCFTTLVGLSIPFFGGLLGFFGGLVFAPTSYFVPCIMWLVLYKPKLFSFHWIVCWISIILGVSLMLLAPIGGMKTIIDTASNYEFFS